MRYKRCYRSHFGAYFRVNSYYRNRQALVTGGLGFIGSNLSRRLSAAGARVTVVDSSVAGCGANPRNLEGVRGIRVVHADIGSPETFAREIRAADLIFNVAGEVSHIHSMRQPARDAELNASAQLRFLEGCARLSPGLRVVYASTRQIYGAPRYLPVDEAHPILPVDFNGVHKYAGTSYHLLYHAMGRLDTRVLCLTNVYGPRMALHIPGQGFLGSFLRRVLLGQHLEVFGDGRQLRDPVFVDDAVDAFLAAGAAAIRPPACGMSAAWRRSAWATSPAPSAPPPPRRRRSIAISPRSARSSTSAATAPIPAASAATWAGVRRCASATASRVPWNFSAAIGRITCLARFRQSLPAAFQPDTPDARSLAV